MALGNRYQPPHTGLDAQGYGMDFSNIIPPGRAIVAGTLAVLLNTNPPQLTSDFDPVPQPTIFGRRLFVTLTGGVNGTDYLLNWVANDGSGQVFSRVALLLCSTTS